MEGSNGEGGEAETSGGDGQQPTSQVTVLEPSKNVNDVIQQLLELSEQVTDPETAQHHIQQVHISYFLCLGLFQKKMGEEVHRLECFLK